MPKRQNQKNTHRGKWIQSGLRYGLMALFAIGMGVLFSSQILENSSKYSLEINSSDSIYLHLPDIIVTIGTPQMMKTLRLTASLELAQTDEETVTREIPRIIDAANRKLRMMSLSEIMRTGANTDISKQLYQETSTILGEGKIRKILISQFVIS